MCIFCTETINIKKKNHSYYANGLKFESVFLSKALK